MSGGTSGAPASRDTATSAGGGATGTTSGATSTTGAASPSGATGEAMDASAILSQLAVANETEIQEAKTAASKASSPQVKRFANALAQQHQQNLQQGRALARQMKISLTAGTGTASESQSAAMGEMAGKSGADFDRAFLEHQIQAHQQNIDKIQNTMLPAANDAQLKSYLQKTVTAMQGHLKQAQQLEEQLNKSSS
jgi:putative membrane protein